MEAFNVNYYAHHVRFLHCLFKNYDEIDNIGKCQEAFEKVSKETLLRDFASRAFYTIFLKARDEMSLSNEVSHKAVQEQLEKKYKNLYRDLKEFRVESDYKTDNPLTSPLNIDSVASQYYPERILGIMDKFLALTDKELAYSHVVLLENIERKKKSTPQKK